MIQALGGLKVSRPGFPKIYLVTSWVAGNEVIVKNVNANMPVSLSWLLLPFLALLCFAATAQFIDSSFPFCRETDLGH